MPKLHIAYVLEGSAKIQKVMGLSSFGGNFGQLIRDQRGVEGLTQEALAFQAGVTKAQISDLENGKILNPQAKTVDALCVALNIPREARLACNSIGSVALPPNALEELAERFGLNNQSLTEAGLVGYLHGKAEEFQKMAESLSALSAIEARLQNVVSAAHQAFENGDFQAGDLLLAGAESTQRTGRVREEIAVLSKIRMERGKASLMVQEPETAHEHFRTAANFFDGVSESEKAETLYIAANLLREHGLRYPSRALEYAINMFEDALNFWQKEQHPKKWRMAANYLAISIHRVGSRLTKAEGEQLVLKAVGIHREVLQNRSKQATPTAWGESMNNLGIALSRLGRFSNSNEEKQRYFGEAIETHVASLSVRDREERPVAWGVAMYNLGYTYRHLGACCIGSEALDYFDRSIQHYKDALEVRTYESNKGAWAMTVTGLSATLRLKGKAIGGDRGFPYLEEALGKADEVLASISLERRPISWAEAAESAANALVIMAKEDRGRSKEHADRAMYFSKSIREIANTDDLAGMRERAEEIENEINDLYY